MKRWWPVVVGVGLVVVGAGLAVAAWPAGVTLDGMQMQGMGRAVVWSSPVPSALGLLAVVVGLLVVLLGWWRPPLGRVSTWVWGLAVSVVAVVASRDAWLAGVRAHYEAVYGAGRYLPPVAPLAPQALAAAWVMWGALAAVLVCSVMTVVLAVRSGRGRRAQVPVFGE